jgi:hypothetical protein
MILNLRGGPPREVRDLHPERLHKNDSGLLVELEVLLLELEPLLLELEVLLREEVLLERVLGGLGGVGRGELGGVGSLGGGLGRLGLVGLGGRLLLGRGCRCPLGLHLVSPSPPALHYYLSSLVGGGRGLVASSSTGALGPSLGGSPVGGFGVVTPRGAGFFGGTEFLVISVVFVVFVAEELRHRGAGI